jgi:hypothetical protein
MGLYGYAIHGLNQQPRSTTSQEMQISLPRFIQVSIAMGDQHLAANLAVFRALIASTEMMTADNYAIQAQIQTDAAWLNPRHEDNYYIAAAILPWNKELMASQEILQQASNTRPFDWQPAFYHAFNDYYFNKNPAGAAKQLLEIRNRATDPNDKMALQHVAVLWLEKGYRANDAARVINAIAQQSNSKEFKRYLEARAERLNMLQKLRDAAKTFRLQSGKNPQQLNDLLRAGLITSIPQDPFNFGFDLDSQGEPILLNKPKRATK